jgi:Fe2+ transport system protein FeoA
MFMKLNELKPGDVLIRKVAPFGDPIQVRIRGYELSFRKEEADKIDVRLK